MQQQLSYSGCFNVFGDLHKSSLRLTSSLADEMLRPISSSSLVALVGNVVSFSVGLVEADAVSTQIR